VHGCTTLATEKNVLIDWTSEKKTARQISGRRLTLSAIQRRPAKKNRQAIQIAEVVSVLDPPYDIELVFVQKITFVLRKINKSAATRVALSDSNMHQIVCRLRLRPRPHWGGGAYSAPPDSLAVFRGAYLLGGVAQW